MNKKLNIPISAKITVDGLSGFKESSFNSEQIIKLLEDLKNKLFTDILPEGDKSYCGTRSFIRGNSVVIENYNDREREWDEKEVRPASELEYKVWNDVQNVINHIKLNYENTNN